MDSNNTPVVTPGEQNNQVNDEILEAEAATAVEQIINTADSPNGKITTGDTSAKKGSGKGMVIAVALLALVAAGGIGFGVWAMMDGNNQTKTLNDQISSLKKQNSELMDKLNKQEEKPVDGDAADGQYKNPVIKSSDPNIGYVTTLEVGGVNKRIQINVKNGTIYSCNVFTDGGLGSECEISGISGDIYSMVHFLEGQDFNSNDGVGFIMADGTVEYFSLMEAMENDDYSIKGKLNIDGYVVNAFNIEVGNESSYSGAASTIFVLRDGSILKFNESMLN